MTPAPFSTTSPSAGLQSAEKSFKVVRKRNRVPLSCGPCRYRKLKCNRSHPCENCVRRGDALSCSYTTPKTKQSHPRASSPDMQDRIDRLENLVLSLMTNGTQIVGPSAAYEALESTQNDSSGSSTKLDEAKQDGNFIKEEDESAESDVDGVATSMGALKVDTQRTMYFGENHWHLVLSDIKEVKSFYASHKQELEKGYQRIQASKPAANGPASLLGSHPSASASELRSDFLPSRSDVERLVDRFFSTYGDPAVYIVHAPSFNEDLHAFWRDPSDTPISFLGLLYSILCLAMRSYHQMADEPAEWSGRTSHLADEYRQRTVQCLVMADYTKPSRYTIETLIFYLNSEYNSQGDADESQLWLLTALIVRLAQRMGLHRDSHNYSGLSPLQSELRRRVWAIVRHLDSHYAFNLALPSMISDKDCDTELPCNLYEDELRKTPLPAPRPIDEPTPVSSLIAKGMIAREFSSILELVSSVRKSNIHYEDILKADEKMRTLRKDEIPDHAQFHPDFDRNGTSMLLTQQFILDILYHKTLCVLHRKYFSRALQNSKYSYSRRMCVEAAMEILRRHSTLQEESHPSGALYNFRFHIASATKTDSLLAGMIIALDLYSENSATESSDSSRTSESLFWTPDQRKAMLKVLEQSQAIWEQSAESAYEAYKASKVLKVLLDKLNSTRSSRTKAQYSIQPDTHGLLCVDKNNTGPGIKAPLTINALSGSSSTGTISNSADHSVAAANMDTNMSGTEPGMSSSHDPFAGFTNVPTPISNTDAALPGTLDMPVDLDWDWDAWDAYIQNGGGNMDFNFQLFPTSLDGPYNARTEGQETTSSSMFNNGLYMGDNPSTTGS